MKAFFDLLEHRDKLKDLLKGSHIFGDAVNYDYWYNHRYPITKAINRSGTILDIGCANGFLLRSLLEWSEYELIPYGADIDNQLLEQCKAMFPGLEHHFVNLPLHRLDEAASAGLPAQFDFVYWNVWDDFYFDDKHYDGYLDKAYAAVKGSGRLILGFYDGNLDVINRKLDWLTQNFQPAQTRLESDTREEIFAWFEK